MPEKAAIVKITWHHVFGHPQAVAPPPSQLEVGNCLSIPPLLSDQSNAMLFELHLDDDGADDLELQPFLNLQQVNRLEKDLEKILADHLYNTLYQQAPLMPFFQERAFQEEADLYALNEDGDLVIFELKRGGAGSGAVQQILRYAQDAGQWSYAELSERYSKYTDGETELAKAHKEEFELDEPLSTEQFNRRQQLKVVGNAADTELVEAVEYWTGQGLDLSFVPYRIYEIGGSHYFEFFAKPNDQRVNPADRKGVIFDTNRSYDEDAVWDMLEKERVAAYGGSKDQADRVDEGDIVFLSHKNHGIIAAADVVTETKQDGDEELYHDVDFRTPVPSRGEDLPSMSFSEVSDVTGESFFWARTVKNPYLTREQAEELAGALQDELQSEE